VKRLGLALVLALVGCNKLKDVSQGKITASDIETAKKGAAVVKKIGSLAEEVKPEQEYYVGRAVATNILAKLDYKYLDKEALADGKLEGVTAYVNNVGQVLAAVATETRKKGDRPAPIAGWRFVVLQSDSINAYAAPGGFIFVTTAAVAAAKNEDELAAILAHEIAHVLRGHALGNIKKSRYADVGAETLQAAGSATLSPQQVEQLNGLMEGLIEDTMDAIFVKGYSRDTEFEADARALEILNAAGYGTGGLLSFLETLTKNQDTGEGGVTATHPKATDRIEKVKSAGAVAKATPKVRSERFVAATKSLRK
jgi:beta-barrel assembly-enhancing protease